MRAGRHQLSVAILGILVAGVANRDQAVSAEAVHETHPHQAESCSTCHMGSRASARTDLQEDVCATCHEQTSPAEYSLGTWGPDGLTERSGVSAAGFEDPNSGYRDGSDDSGDQGGDDDHGDHGDYADEADHDDHGDYPDYPDEADHADHPDYPVPPDYADEADQDDHGSRCTRCHSFHTPTRITLAEREADIANPKVANHCSTCHSHADATKLARLTEGHKAAAVLYHWMASDLAEYTLSDACLICHDQSKGLPTNLPTFLPVSPRFDTHASHPYGVRMAGTGDFFRPVVDSRIHLFDGQIECQTCHDLSAENEDLIVVFETKYEMCRGCHTQGLPQGRVQDGLVQR